MPITIFVSVAGHVPLADIYDYLPLLSILFFLHLQQALWWVFVLFLEG